DGSSDSAVMKQLRVEILGLLKFEQDSSERLGEHHLGEALEHDRRSRSRRIDLDRHELERGGQPWQRMLSVARHSDDARKRREQRMLPAAFEREGAAEKIGVGSPT